MISIVIPTFKRPDLLKRLLESISKQTIQASEVIIVDDCSNMEEEYNSVINEFESKINILKYIALKKNTGAPNARNVGILAASSEWIALVDDDDEWLPEKLEKQIALIHSKKNKKLALVYTWCRAIGQNKNDSYESCHSYRGDVKTQLLSTNFIMSASVLVKKTSIIQVGLFNITLPSCQDWDMWVRLSLHDFEFDVVEEILAIYHRHGGDSIGLSSNAKLGYKIFLTNYWKQIIIHTPITNWIKKLYLYVSVYGATWRDK